MPGATGVVQDAGVPRASLDLDQADATRAERVQRVGGAEFRDADAGVHCRTHDRRAGGNRDLLSVDRQRDPFGRGTFRRSVVDFLDQGHPCLLE